MSRHGPTSINIDQELWIEVKKAMIDLDVTATTDFHEQALRKKLTNLEKIVIQKFQMVKGKK